MAGKHLAGSASARKEHGNMLVLTTAITIGLVMALLFFALNYARLLNSNNEQRTCIENVALRAAERLGRIVINDQKFGFISLSNYAPTGAYTNAGDNYYLPVHSINDILATNRLCMIIAQKLNDSGLMAIAESDYADAIRAKQRLVQELQDAILETPQGTHKDINGNVVNVYQDALAAYNSNRIRMAESKSYFLPKSLKLTLGSLIGAPTNTKIPQPQELAGVDPSQIQNNCYKAGINIPYLDKSFVFFATVSNITLVDPRNFQDGSTIAGPSADIAPSVIKAEADHHISIWGPAGNEVERAVHAVACAVPACVGENTVAPGALTISFPDGRLGDLISTPLSMLTNDVLNSTPITISRSTGDTPLTGSTLTSYDLPGGNTVSNFFRHGVYDWLRRCGTKTNIDSVRRMFDTTLGDGRNVFELFQDGTVMYYALPLPYPANGNSQGGGPASINTDAAKPYFVTSDRQLYTKAKNILTLGADHYNIYGHNEVYQPGTTDGGKHAGEPLPCYTSGFMGGQNQFDPSDKHVRYLAFSPLPNSTLIAGFGIDCGGGGSGCGTTDSGTMTQSSIVSGLGVATVSPIIGSGNASYWTFPDGPCGGAFRDTWQLPKQGLDVDMTCRIDDKETQEYD
jgi:hypothetical protein